MKIRVKVKTIIFSAITLAVIFFWGIPQATLGIANYLDSRDPDRAQLFYEKYADTKKTISARLLYAESLVNTYSRFVIYSQGWGGGSGFSREEMDKAEEMLHLNLEKEPSKAELKDYVSSYRMLMDMAIAEGSPDKLKKLIEWGKRGSIQEINDASNIYLAFLHSINREWTEAEIILEQLEKIGNTDPGIQIIRGEMALFQGRFEDAQKVFEELGKRNWKAMEDTYFGSSAYLDRRFWLENSNEFLGNDGFLKGRIVFEGKPMAFVEVYLQEADGGFRTGGGGYIAITDENGYFSSIKIKRGLYDVGIGTIESVLVDKIGRAHV